jgi:hypothetical protein
MAALGDPFDRHLLFVLLARASYSDTALDTKKLPPEQAQTGRL